MLGEEKHYRQAQTDEWREYVTAKLKINDRRIDTLGDDLTRMRTQLGENNAATSRIESNTAEMLGVFESWKGAMRTLELIGKLAKPITYILGVLVALAGLWTAFKTGAGK